MSHSSLNNRDNIFKTAWKVCRYYMIVDNDTIICEESFFTETASECLSFACTAPNILQISAFLISKDWLLKRDGLKQN
jgi:hypothetical protein